MKNLLAISGLVGMAILSIAAYPYVQIDGGKILITDGKIQFSAAESDITATGGTITNYTENGTNWQAHIFTNVGATSFVVTAGAGNVEVLIVAGGGGGGGNIGGGGGAGGFVLDSTSVAVGTYSVVVGVGSTGTYGNGDQSGQFHGNGTDSTFTGIIAFGGGVGGSYNTPAYINGSNGGSGGGASLRESPPTAGVAGSATNGQGFAGGGAVDSTYAAGGGGGAGSVGTNVAPSKSGNGGIGKQCSYSGTNVFYCGGGGGGYTSPPGQGGSDIGGNGAEGTTHGKNGVATTGSGGGGGGYWPGTGGDGGSGIVIVRYKK